MAGFMIPAPVLPAITATDRAIFSNFARTCFLARVARLLPRIHETVFIRIRNNAHLYAPKGLPARYEIVKADGEVLSPEQNPYERLRPSAGARSIMQDRVWNTIWWRRLRLLSPPSLVSVYLFTFPLLRLLPVSDQLHSPLRWVSDIVGDGSATSCREQRIPGSTHTNAPLAGSWWSSVLLIAVTWWGSFSLRENSKPEWSFTGDDRWVALSLIPVSRRIGSIACATVQAVVAAYHVAKQYIAPALFAALCVYLGVTLASHGLSNVVDDFGLVCRERPVQYGVVNNVLTVKDFNGLKDLQKNQTLDPKPIFNTMERCQSLGVWVEANRSYLVHFGKTADGKPKTRTLSSSPRSMRRTPFAPPKPDRC